MGVLQRFERRLGGLVEGAFAKVFKGDVQPVEIASALQRETDDRKTIVGQGRVLVPNAFVVELGKHDHARLDPWAKPLSAELAAMVREHAAEQGYSFVGPVSVTLELLPDVDTGVFRVRSGVSAGQLAEGDPPPVAVSTNAPRLVLAGEGAGAERMFPLTHSVTVVGRASDTDIRLNDPGVSRRHAEIRQEGGDFIVVDLGSTNGVRVNDSTVTRQQLRSGDRVEIGSTTLVFRRDKD